MDPETEKIIKEQMKKLPIEVTNLLADLNLGGKILGIGKRNGLDENQSQALQLETNLMLLGLVHPDDFSDELTERLKINDTILDNIVNDINKEILSGIREKLIETFNKNVEPSTDEETEIEPKLDERFGKDVTKSKIFYFGNRANREAAHKIRMEAKLDSGTKT
ncbi:hypothetical protein A3D42_02600 [Candidatus Nomurabacteria bacterium RIFCSPHIGHO2_02_FULL_41_18]|uniref:Uncharacterized protein n=1 Tax=Candidatus Nomurabacteria bacterium RIFCSPHIGHO2_02_FULL_41_18 TaxID=1801754 RepID=A0A1F6W5N4_9BACT|nr:MAG: hypothetical protein A2737_01075 [Candidatus Nomurabacteria bacterium RIFCSPHIGHO2_01_FULL_41_71]OGI76995.1 MAG: hypothetical protein A3D42_02600 [Candidatus Nomurabacteria bacterium RIFCSPHIGHO2_02_FULL_41_18]OGI89836.1 MAG: hypothetical protein A3B01_03515 [Candidatus Nomurabacteria bacterium RIFCSPLOWO2_01_FULL_41_52b]OGJ00024.1 MAG: hypothetical protein A3I90_02410 [Candidatus Nomurabacteria bacterium RIFCSPLOWO2_02_FULL_41_9]